MRDMQRLNIVLNFCNFLMVAILSKDKNINEQRILHSFKLGFIKIFQLSRKRN